MNIITFKYTKADGKESQRTLAVSITPNKFYAGTDISELAQEEQAIYAVKMSDAKAAYLKAIADINAEFDVKHNYRQFDPNKMSNVIEEEI